MLTSKDQIYSVSPSTISVVRNLKRLLDRNSPPPSARATCFFLWWSALSEVEAFLCVLSPSVPLIRPQEPDWNCIPFFVFYQLRHFSKEKKRGPNLLAANRIVESVFASFDSLSKAPHHGQEWTLTTWAISLIHHIQTRSNHVNVTRFLTLKSTKMEQTLGIFSWILKLGCTVLFHPKLECTGIRNNWYLQ